MPVCPLCARRVAASATTCRCGHTISANELTVDQMSVGAAEAEPKSSSLFGAVSIGVAVLGVVMWMTTRGESSVPQRRAAAAATSSPTPAAPTPPVVDRTPAPPVVDPPDSVAEDVADPAARVAAALAASRSAAAAAAANAPPAGSAAPMSLEDLVSRSMPAVVRVETSGSIGSGFFIAPDTIVTNAHVVSANAVVTIRRPGGSIQSARVETTAREVDMAVMKISSPDPNQPMLTMGSGMRARAGQEVVALGSPLGLQNTVTRGIVSAVRQVGGLTLVQTDAAINPGNSGGPLLDRTGQVIGITSLGMRSSVAQGLGFAIAIEHAQALLSGRPPTSTSDTPLTTLNRAMTVENATGDTRGRASKAYEQGIAMVAQRADALDGQWQAFVRTCYQGRIVGTFDREWYALWDAHALQGAVRPGCTTVFADLQRIATEIRTAVTSLDEAARRDDVYPGTRRDVLRRYRLDYASR